MQVYLKNSFGKSMLRPLMGFALLLIFAVANITTFTAPAHANSENIPRILSKKDIKTYREIIKLQTDGKWRAADRKIKRLNNDLLKGHLLFQRYMHPNNYRSSYKELRNWMNAYADHPGAWRVYKLAKKRQGRARAPKRPIQTRYPGVTGQSALPSPPTPRRGKADRRTVNRFKANVRRYVSDGKPDRAEKRYWAMAQTDLLAPHEAASALERIAASHYYNGHDKKAYALSELAAKLSRETEPSADWIAGLSAWRMGDIQTAFDHFKMLSGAERARSWLEAAGQYWAARAALKLGNAEDAHKYLMAASKHSETFYGLLATRQLGLTPTFDWNPPQLNTKAVSRLLVHPAVKRAIALTEIGRDDLADEELRLLWGRKGTAVQDDLLAFSSALNLPAIQVRLGRAGGTGRAMPAAVRYPVPDWAPVDGLRIDRAMIYAMVRKESDFRTRGRSGAGARGLMQVMPATASYIAGDRSLFRRNKNRLFEPEFNMALGQQYIEYLLEAPHVEGNLFMLLAAYNGGPGSLMRWKREVDYGENDPLLFIESIGFYETRDYIESVMTNIWLYRIRLGQPTPSLDAVASGAWPMLEFFDSPEARAVEARRQQRLNARTWNLFDED